MQPHNTTTNTTETRRSSMPPLYAGVHLSTTARIAGVVTAWSDAAAGRVRRIEVKSARSDRAWAERTRADTACPASLGEPDDYVDGIVTPDPWGHPYQLGSGATLPERAKGLGAWSLGPDGRSAS